MTIDKTTLFFLFPLSHNKPTPMAIAAAITLPPAAVHRRSFSSPYSASSSFSRLSDSSSFIQTNSLKSVAVGPGPKHGFRVFSRMSVQAPEKSSETSSLNSKEGRILHFVKYHGLGNDFILVISVFRNNYSYAYLFVISFLV